MTHNLAFRAPSRQIAHASIRSADSGRRCANLLCFSESATQLKPLIHANGTGIERNRMNVRKLHMVQARDSFGLVCHSFSPFSSLDGAAARCSISIASPIR